MKRKYFFLLFSVVLLIVCFFIARRLSFTISLHRSGFTTSDYEEIEHNYDRILGEFKVIQTETKNGQLAIVLMKKDKLGFWNVDYSNKAIDSKSNFIEFSFIRNTSIKRYDAMENGIIEHEWNYIYFGTDAIQSIRFKPEQIPENIIFNIDQFHNKYCIHLTTYSDPDIIGDLDVEKILVENNCIGPVIR